MKTYKLTLEYDGLAFNGWQVQANGQRTVQGVVEEVLLKIFGHPLRLIASGRTDAGVHARGQVAHFRVVSAMPCEALVRAMNDHLPPDVVVVRAEEAGAGFHAQHGATGKTYTYTVLNRSFPTALERNRCYYFPRRLNLALMKKEARVLVGEHDFSAFANVDPSRKSDAVRHLRKLDIRRSGDRIVFTLEGDGFLYKMVRNVVGTLLEIGTGRFPPGSLKNILAGGDRRAAGKAVAPQGLCLERVEY